MDDFVGLMKFDIKLFSSNAIYLYHVRLALLLPLPPFSTRDSYTSACQYLQDWRFSYLRSSFYLLQRCWKVLIQREVSVIRRICFSRKPEKSARPTSYAAEADIHLLSSFQAPTYALVNGSRQKNLNILYLNSSEILQMLIQKPI